MSTDNLMIVQGGGPTAVFNASLAAIVEEAQGSAEIGQIYGARRGTLGLIHDDVADLTRLSSRELERLRMTPGAALQSSRHKPNEGEFAQIVETLRAREIGYLLFLGGNGTMRGAQAISALCGERGLGHVRVIGVPKTVDNDIAETDRCPGFASAARYYAASVRELGADLRSLPQPVTILETMGRNVGWIAAATMLSRDAEDGAPQIIALPEMPFDIEAFLDELDRLIRLHGWAVAVVAEGLRFAGGAMVWENATPSQADALGRPMCGGVGQHLADVVSSRLRVRCRNEKPGLLGRASIALAAEQDRVDADVVGHAGVEAALQGKTDVMVALNALDGAAKATHRMVPLLAVAGHERLIPGEWLRGGPLPVADEFLEYVRPLVGPLDDYLVRLPQAASLSGVSSV